MISVIIPTYNERDNLEELIRRIDEALAGAEYEVIVVDDNSPDGTAEVAKALSSSYPVRVKVRPGKMGLSSAVVEGLELARGDVIAVMDADLQHPPELLPELYRRIEKGCDIAIASRYVEGGSVAGWGLVRRVISRGSILLARVLLPRVRGVRDPSSGFFMFRRSVLEGVTDRLDPKGFKILLEILVKGKYSKVCEVPYTFGLRRRGSSKLGGRVIASYLVQVLDLSPPIVRFALVGAVGTLVNLAVLWLLRYWLGLAHEVASAAAIEVSLLSNFALNDIWTFKRRRRSTLLQSVVRYHAANLAGIITQYAVSVSLYRILSLESLTSQFIGIIAGFLVNYSLSKSVVWW